MYPVNQVILGGDPMLNSINDIEAQMQLMDSYKNKLQQLKNVNQMPGKLVWDDIDAEIEPMSDEQKERLMQNEEYLEVYAKVQNIVQAEILNLVKARIEGTPEGKELLSHQLKIIRKLKSKIISDTNREMDLFKKFKEYSKSHPDLTYDEFIKSNTL